MSDSINCPACGASSSGNYCSSCGASLGGRHCTQCGRELESGARFCNECGAPVGASAPARAPAPAPPAAPAGSLTPGAAGGRDRASVRARRSGAQGTGQPSGSGQMGWWAAGAMMVLLVMILALPILQPEEPRPPVQAAGGGAPPAATTDISNMSPIEAASRLYDRVMRAASANDTAQVQMFLPMAIDAHELARPLSSDAAFHLSSLQRMAVRNEEALASAQAALDQDPNHLLLLYTAGEAARALGQTGLSREYATRIVEVWDEEMALGREEYGLHNAMMDDIRAFGESGG